MLISLTKMAMYNYVYSTLNIHFVQDMPSHDVKDLPVKAVHIQSGDETENGLVLKSLPGQRKVCLC